jgi:hypothetical protein
LELRSGLVSRYRITDDDIKYAAEFRADPLGTASPGLQRVMNLLRGGPKSGKYVLVVREPFRRWVLGRMPAERGQPVEILEGEEFTDLAVAEWTVFKLRWRDHTGRDLDEGL